MNTLGTLNIASGATVNTMSAGTFLQLGTPNSANLATTVVNGTGVLNIAAGGTLNLGGNGMSLGKGGLNTTGVVINNGAFLIPQAVSISPMVETRLVTSGATARQRGVAKLLR